jgi:hypothetical protein
MIDVMFDMPSQKEKELRITLGYAVEKLDKSILSKLKVA